MSELVIVERREPDYMPLRLSSYNINAVVGDMEEGDYRFFPQGLIVGIERKTIPDLFASLKDRRLVTQAHKLVEAVDSAWLLREGAFRIAPNRMIEFQVSSNKWIESGWSWDSFQGIMLDLQMLGMNIVDAPKGEAHIEIARMATNMARDTHKWIRERQRPEVFSLDSQYTAAIWAGCAFEGIGPERMEALLKEFRTFADIIIMAAVNDGKGLTKVEGIGPATAKPR